MLNTSSLGIADASPRLALTCASALPASPSGNALAAALQRACSTTCMAQTFYRPEFERACTTLRSRVAQGAESEPADMFFRNFAVFLDELQGSAQRGLVFRFWRDGISLVMSAALLGCVAYGMADEMHGEPDDRITGMSLPPAAQLDWILMLCEWSKSLVTSSLSYPTLQRHHMVDEFAERMRASVSLLGVCLSGQSGSVLRADEAGLVQRLQQHAWLWTEKMRHVATVFTLLNTILPLARSSLLLSEKLSGIERFALWRRLLRLVQNASDSARAMFSTVGTVARKQLFGSQLEQVKNALPLLYEQCQGEHGERWLPQLKKLELLFSAADTRLLRLIAASPKLTADFQRCDITSQDALQDFFECHQIPVAVSAEGNFLYLSAVENIWGKQLRNGTYQAAPGSLMRAPYRLTLTLQQYISRPWERLTGSGREADLPAVASADASPDGVHRDSVRACAAGTAHGQ